MSLDRPHGEDAGLCRIVTALSPHGGRAGSSDFEFDLFLPKLALHFFLIPDTSDWHVTPRFM